QLPVIPLEPHGVAAATPRELLQFRPRLIIHHISAAPPCKLGFWPGFREDRRRSVLEYVSTGPQRKRSQNPRSQGVLSRCDESLDAACLQKLACRPSVAPSGTSRAASIPIARGERLRDQRGGREVREVFVVRAAMHRTETAQSSCIAARLETLEFS